MKPQFFADNDYIFLEGDEVNGVYFLIKGEGAFVLPSFENTNYINITIGDQFGILDIVGSQQTKQFDLDEWFVKKNLLQR